ncbi:MAG: LCP family protein [Actinobacteria bacterium]|nr:LCP family protein [Actinomycetota bacterium]
MTGEEQGRMGAHGRLVRAFLASTAALALVVGALGAYGYATFVAAAGVVSTFTTSAGPAGSPRDFGPCVRNVCNYLILGSDSRAGLPPGQVVQFGSNKAIGGSNRSDVIILVHTDPRQDKSVILSFPRDLWVSIPGKGENKINSAFEGGLNGGGPQLVARTVENLTGLHINHVLYVNLAGFEGVVKALGGVNMCVPANLVNTADGRIYDILTGLDIRPGCQLLDPLQALAYVRTRHLPCDFIPDFSRIGRQQQFLRAVLNRLLQPSEISKAPSLIKPIAHNLVTDPGFKLADIIYLVKQLQGIGDPTAQAQADFRAVPGSTATITVSWSSIPLSIVRMDPSAEELFKALRNGRPLPPNVGVQLPGTATSPANIPTLVVDHDSAGKAAGVASTLSESGFDITPGTTTYAGSGLKVKGSSITYAPGSLSDAQVVAQYFPGLRLVQAPKHVLPRGTKIAIVISASYRPQPVGQGPSSSGQCVSPS